MKERYYGLRFQIISSLGFLILILSGLLGFAIIKISASAIEKEKERAVKLTQLSAAKNISVSLGRYTTRQEFRNVASTWLATGEIDGVWFFDGSGNLKYKLVTDTYYDVKPVPRFPSTEIYQNVRFTGKVSGEEAGVNIFLQYPLRSPVGCVIIGSKKRAVSYSYLGSILLLYLLLHAIAILTFGYFSLTRIIVGPVDQLRRKAVRLGEGKFDQIVAGLPSGAKEIIEVDEALSKAGEKLKIQHEELIEKIRQLEAARDEILKSQEALLRSQKLATVGRLTAGVAHEIGNPLTAIAGFIGLLCDETLSDKDRKEYLKRVKDEVDRVSKIIRDLLTYARADSKELEKIELVSVINKTIDVLKPQKLFKEVKIKVNIEDGIPPVRGNADRMMQVLVNLLMNSAEAMVGSGRILVGVKRAEGRNEVILYVEDTGPGITGEVMKDIFEPFVTTKPHGQGTGLGLSVCHGIITSFGGKIEAENVEGGGARFTIVLPVFESNTEKEKKKKQ